jgi:hypothetical protein
MAVLRLRAPVETIAAPREGIAFPIILYILL